MILSGKKIWEIRRQNTSVRGEIGLALNRYRYGTALLIEVRKMAIKELKENFDKHKVSPEELEKYLKGKSYGYAYVLADIKKYKIPIEIPRSYGVWINDKGNELEELSLSGLGFNKTNKRRKEN